MLEATGSQTVEVDGKRISGKRLLARLLWQAATTGKAVLPNAVELHLAPRDWFELIKFIYTHIDGPAKQTLEHTGADGGPIQSEVKHVGDLSDDDLIRIASRGS